MLLPLAALGQSPLLWTLSWLLGQLALVLYWRLGLFNFLRLQRGGPRLVPDPVQRRPLGHIAAGARSLPADALLAGGAGRRVRRHPADPAGAVRCRLPWVWPAWLGWLAAAYLRWHHRFIAGLALGCLSLIVVLLTALGKWMEPDVDGFLLLCLIAIGLSVAASRWLQQQRRPHE